MGTTQIFLLIIFGFYVCGSEPQQTFEMRIRAFNFQNKNLQNSKKTFHARKPSDETERYRGRGLG